MSRVRQFLSLWLLAALPVCAGGCAVLSIKEDNARREKAAGSVDPARFVAGKWTSDVVPEVQRRAVPLPDLLAALPTQFDRECAAHGRRAGEGSPCTFAVRGSATVAAVDRASQRGLATLDIATPGGTQQAGLQIGPIVSGTVIRDALPFVSFNDFADQIAFAEIGNALTARAMRDTGPTLRALKPGDRVDLLAVANVGSGGDRLLLTPVRVGRLP